MQEHRKGFNPKGFAQQLILFCFFQATVRLQASPAGSSGKCSVTPPYATTFFLGEPEALNSALCSLGQTRILTFNTSLLQEKNTGMNFWYETYT